MKKIKFILFTITLVIILCFMFITPVQDAQTGNATTIVMNYVFKEPTIEQIKISADQTGSGSMGLRIAARMTPDESVDYGMGFDEPREDDIQFECNGVTILIAPGDEELLHGAHIDFVELEPGSSNFIFLNPNDPNYKPPTEEGAIKED